MVYGSYFDRSLTTAPSGDYLQQVDYFVALIVHMENMYTFTLTVETWTTLPCSGEGPLGPNAVRVDDKKTTLVLPTLMAATEEMFRLHDAWEAKR